MKKLVSVSLLILILLLTGCSSMKENDKPPERLKTPETTNFGPVEPEEISDDPTYGYSHENPIKTGGVNNGPTWQRTYLETLTGPNGEDISFKKIGTYPELKIDDIAPDKQALDIYEITYEGLDKPIKLYLDQWHYEQPKAPKGFKIIEK